MTREKTITEEIFNAQICEKINLTKYHFYLVELEFSEEYLDRSKEQLFYTWKAKTNRGRTIFPMQNLNDIKFFKTLKGAKRNFIRNYVKEKEV